MNHILWISLLTTTHTGIVAQTNQNRSDIDRADENAVLNPQDIGSGQIYKTVRREWVTGIDATGKPQGRLAVLQEIEVDPVKIRVHYGEFASEGEARVAAAYYITNVASVFHRGMWGNMTNKLLGDEVWSARDSANAALLIRARQTLVLVSCREGGPEQQVQLAEFVAGRIADKVKAGKRVIVPTVK